MIADRAGRSLADVIRIPESLERRAVATPALAAFAIYLAISLALFGRVFFQGPGPAHCICFGNDEGIFVWALAWWPHALLHGLNPFYTHAIYAPHGFDIALGALVPGAALLLWPVTAVAGPLYAYNVGMLLSPVLAAFFAFLLCRRLTGRKFWASLVGGWLFGFSTYMFGELAGHMHLTLVFLLPAIVHWVLRALAGEISRRRFVIGLVIMLVLQLSFAGETFVSFTLFGFAAILVACLLGSAELRMRLGGVIGPIVVAYAITAVIVSPYLYYAFQPGALPTLPWRDDHFSTDVLAFFFPSAITEFGGHRFLPTTSVFVAGPIEGGAYLGLPLMAMMWLSIRRGWGRPEVKIMVATLAIVVVSSLGGHLNIEGPTSIPLPWWTASHLPVLGLMLPSRFVVYVFLIGAILAATWLAATKRRVLPWTLAVASVAALLPALGIGYWNGTPDIPAFFTNSSYRHLIGPRDTALVLPVGSSGNSMLWQAMARLRFPMASGYAVPPEADDPYKRSPLYPTLTAGAVIPDVAGAAASFLAANHITVAVFEPTDPLAKPWPGIFKQLGWTGVSAGGVDVMRPPAGWNR